VGDLTRGWYKEWMIPYMKDSKLKRRQELMEKFNAVVVRSANRPAPAGSVPRYIDASDPVDPASDAESAA
jgi:hypothetical protein